jgi:hypothetical protein
LDSTFNSNSISNPTSTAIVGNSGRKGWKYNSKQFQTKNRRAFLVNKSDSNKNHNTESKIYSFNKELTCFYCCRKGYKSTKYKLKKKADKLCKTRAKIDSNTKVAQVKEATANIADTTILACTTIVAKDDSTYKNSWYIDSGTTDYICNNRNSFIRICQLDIPIYIRIGDEKTIVANQISTVLLNSFKNSKTKKIALLNILYTSELGTNLLSVSKLNSKRYNIIFSYKGHATITDKRNNWLEVAFQKDSIYCLQTTRPYSQFTTANLPIQSVRTAKTTKLLPIQL